MRDSLCKWEDQEEQTYITGRKWQRAQERKSDCRFNRDQLKPVKMTPGSRLYFAGKQTISLSPTHFHILFFTSPPSFFESPFPFSVHISWTSDDHDVIFERFLLLFSHQRLLWCVRLSPSMVSVSMIYWSVPLSFQTNFTLSAPLSPMTWSVPNPRVNVCLCGVICPLTGLFVICDFSFIQTGIYFIDVGYIILTLLSSTGFSLSSCWKGNDAPSVDVPHILPSDSQWQRPSPESPGKSTLYCIHLPLYQRLKTFSWTLRKKGMTADTGVITFQKVHFLITFVSL